MEIETFDQDTSNDTIGAIATAIGGGIAIIRISGPKALQESKRLWLGNSCFSIQERTLKLGYIIDPITTEKLDQALFVYMPNPYSYTGEDVVEIHCHGGKIGINYCLQAVLKADIRLAQEGEFTKRAYLNGKMDLTQAEAVMELINAQSQKALNLALKQLNGALGDKIKQTYQELSHIHAELEVRMDFIEEDLNWQSLQLLTNKMQQAITLLKNIIASFHDSRVIQNGIKMVLAGAPNTGKSSFLNLLLGQNRAIVSDIAGTTRDTIEEQLFFRQIPLHIIDTAGIRATKDIIEQQGIDRSLEATKQADIILWFIDVSKNIEKQYPPSDIGNDIPIIIIYNKIDLTDKKINPNDNYNLSIPISITMETNIAKLYDMIENIVYQNPQEELSFSINLRQKNLLDKAMEQLIYANALLESEQWELVTSHLKESLHNLATILGKNTIEDVLDSIFSSYCIGK